MDFIYKHKLRPNRLTTWNLKTKKKNYQVHTYNPNTGEYIRCWERTNLRKKVKKSTNWQPSAQFTAESEKTTTAITETLEGLIYLHVALMRAVGLVW